MPPKISIGMPVYNGSEYIRQAIDSLLVQSFTDFELIISDNASTDDTQEICKEYAKKDCRICYIRQLRNLGAFLNFKFVLEKATGEFFMWAAIDDLRSPDCLEFYLNLIGQAGGAFSTYAVKDFKSGDIKKCTIPQIECGPKSKKDLLCFFRKPCPSMVYGLYRTVAAKSAFLDISNTFDWLGCYFVLRVINDYGFINYRGDEDFRYFAGIYEEYIRKPCNGRSMDPWPYYFKALPIAVFAGFGAVYNHTKILKNAL